MSLVYSFLHLLALMAIFTLDLDKLLVLVMVPIAMAHYFFRLD